MWRTSVIPGPTRILLIIIIRVLKYLRPLILCRRSISSTQLSGVPSYSHRSSIKLSAIRNSTYRSKKGNAWSIASLLPAIDRVVCHRRFGLFGWVFADTESESNAQPSPDTCA